jgi:hypothetical protein
MSSPRHEPIALQIAQQISLDVLLPTDVLALMQRDQEARERGDFDPDDLDWDDFDGPAAEGASQELSGGQELAPSALDPEEPSGDESSEDEPSEDELSAVRPSLAPVRSHRR